MRKTLLKVALVTIILFSSIVMTQLINIGNSNPIMHYWVKLADVSADKNTRPPTITIFSPENDTVYGADIVSLSLNVSIGDSSTASSCVLEEIFCETDWKSNTISVYEYRVPLVYPYASPRISEFSETINLTGIPDGNHSIMVYAVESGEYPISVVQAPNGDTREFAHYYNGFNIIGCSLVRFTVDTTPPKVTLASPENKTYYSSEVQLNFNISEQSSRIVCSLNGQKNVTISGNATLTNLPYGQHNVTVYAIDIAGHVGASETIYFTIEEPFPTTMVIAPIAIVSVIASGLIIYFKKRKH